MTRSTYLIPWKPRLLTSCSTDCDDEMSALQDVSISEGEDDDNWGSIFEDGDLECHEMPPLQAVSDSLDDEWDEKSDGGDMPSLEAVTDSEDEGDDEEV